MRAESFDESEFDLPLGISTHERCDTCAKFRDWVSGCEAFESIGLWGGPTIETTAGEAIAEGHESVRLVLAAVRGTVPEDCDTCRRYDCDNEATHTIEIDHFDTWFTTYFCRECIDEDRSGIDAVYEGLETNCCESNRCFTIVHESRRYCPSHQGER